MTTDSSQIALPIVDVRLIAPRDRPLVTVVRLAVSSGRQSGSPNAGWTRGGRVTTGPITGTDVEPDVSSGMRGLRSAPR